MIARLSRLPEKYRLPLMPALGALATLSFAPLGWWPLQFLLIALLFGAVLQAPGWRRAALHGWLFSFGWQASGFWWLYVSMHVYGGLPGWMAALAVALLALALGALTALAMAAAKWLQARGTPRALLLLGALPSLWMLAEWTRGWIFTGLPWVVSGYAHTDGVLASFAPVLGVYGLGFLSAVLAACLVLFNWRALGLAIVIVAVGLGLARVQWTTPQGEALSVRLIQGNVPQEMKFQYDQVQAALAMYRDAILAEPADLVATPETALPMLLQRLPVDYLPTLQHFAQASGTYIALGIPVSDSPSSYSNSLLGMRPAGGPLYRYDKHHLVPFGEFIPPGARWFVAMMNIPLGDFHRAPTLQEAFPVKDQKVMPNICYEDLFGEEIAAQLRHDWRRGQLPATVLLNVSNIAWFGDTIALPQHLQISRMRSLETGRPMLRATNTGMTAVIDHHGQVSAQLPSYTRGTLAARVQGTAGATPYMLAGNLAILAIAALLLALSWLATPTSRLGAFFAGGKTR